MLGCDAIATGHYARMGSDAAGRPLLMRGMDPNKDQSYFLWALPHEMLPQLMFPLGELTKPEVREKARGLGLSTAEKPESMEICFVPTGDYAGFLEKRLGAEHGALQPGNLVTASGEVVGEHTGYARYTVGQRKGLGGGRGLPLFVLGTRPDTREVVVGTADELLRGDVRVEEMNWLVGEIPSAGEPVQVQVRHRAKAVPAQVRSTSPESIELQLDQPQRAVTPGQSAVVFRGDVVLGGGRISR